LALYFLDTSALVKVYGQEPGTDRLLSLIIDRPENRFAVLAIPIVEMRSAIRRRQRAGDIETEIAAAILDQFSITCKAIWKPALFGRR
jgi:hypothetical protein